MTEVLYRCDPEKNTECRKLMCFRNGKEYGPCRMTSKPGCAVLDSNGAPIVERIKRGDSDGAH